MIKDREFKAIADYLRWLKHELNLNEWNVYVLEEPPEGAEDGTLAMITPTEGRNVATIRIAPQLMDLSHEEIRRVLCHELLHLHHRNMLEPVRKIGGALSMDAYLILWENMRLASEIMTDQLAYAFARLLEEGGRDTKFLTKIKPESSGHKAVEFSGDN